MVFLMFSLKKFIILSMISLIVAVNSTALAAENNTAKRVALLPVMHLYCHWNHSESEEKALDQLFKREIHIPLNGLLKITEEIPPETSVAAFNKNYHDMKTTNKKADIKDAVKASAEEINADIFILPIAKSCSQETFSLGFDGNVMVSRAIMELFVYDKSTGTVQTYKYHDYYNDTFLLIGTVDSLLKNCANHVLKKANLKQLVTGNN